MAKVSELTVEEKLRALNSLQVIDSEIDEIQTLKGELPMEVSDLADELEGLGKRVEKIEEDLKELDSQSAKHKSAIKEAEALIGKYEHQQNNVKNNREFEALSKEIELQHLDIQLSKKRIKESKIATENKQATLDAAKDRQEKKDKELSTKKDELEKIIEKTEKQETSLLKKQERARKKIEERFMRYYDKLRGAYRNGLAVASIERDSCGGCFNQIPPQKQVEIRQRKKILVCEHCGRIMVDEDINNPLKVEA